jgi:hypothetical protein
MILLSRFNAGIYTFLGALVHDQHPTSSAVAFGVAAYFALVAITEGRR